jgi:hypothetical protein
MERTERRFRIGSYGDEFAAGYCSNGDQVLMGLLCPELVVYRFTAEGVLRGREARPWTYPAPLVEGCYQIYDPEFQKLVSEQIAAWQDDMGFVDKPIDVCAFFDREREIGVTLPDEDVCDFVLWWGKDYWMSNTGEVEST